MAVGAGVVGAVAAVLAVVAASEVSGAAALEEAVPAEAGDPEYDKHGS